MKVLQICHGSIIPKYSSAYSLRVWNYLDPLKDRIIVSIGGLNFRDKTEEPAFQFRSILLMLKSVMKGNRSFEIFLSKGILVRKSYLNFVRKQIYESDIVIFEGPWQFPLFEDDVSGKTLIYDAHNIETDLRRGDQNQEYVSSIEERLSLSSDLVITVTDDDRTKFISSYRINKDKIICIPERFFDQTQKWEGASSNEIVFIGSAYQPNIEAVNHILSLAKELAGFRFKIIGNISTAIIKRGIPENVRFCGTLKEEEKDGEICNSFIAINPVITGSGRNLKMNDYISHGVPVLTTEVGARGFEKELKDKFFIRPLDEFSNAILEISRQRKELTSVSSFFLSYAKEHSYTETTKEAVSAIKGVYEAKKRSL